MGSIIGIPSTRVSDAFIRQRVVSQMLSDQAFALAQDGHNVIVITARQTYANAKDQLPAEERVRGVTVHRVWTSSFGRSRLLGRGIDYASFFLTATALLARMLRTGDVVVTKTDPPLLSILTTPLCKLRGAKAVHWLQDRISIRPHWLPVVSVYQTSAAKLSGPAPQSNLGGPSVSAKTLW